VRCSIFSCTFVVHGRVGAIYVDGRRFEVAILVQSMLIKFQYHNERFPTTYKLLS
jgi:hypothetical protein